MEYFRDPNNQILADMAYRMGKIVLQYKEANIVEERYEATLNISILQWLLTNCQELIRAMSRSERKKCFLSAKLGDNKHLLKISTDMVKRNTFLDNQLTYERVLCHIRDALSHPTGLNIESVYPSTGYTSILGSSDEITTFTFVNSPDTRKNNYKKYPDRSKAEYAKKKLIAIDDFYETVLISEEILGNQQKYFLALDGKPFVRLFRIDISVQDLHDLIVELSNYLAQSMQDGWDGETIKRLVA